MSAAAPKPIFWDVDTQVDFMHPEGKLYVPGAESLLPNLRRLTEFAAQNKILSVASMDAHHEGDKEFQNYPPHCLAGTPGQKKVFETVLSQQYIIPDRPIELPRDLTCYQQVVIEKDHVDVFTNPNVGKLLERLGRNREVYVYGVVTEVCVSLAAKGLLERGYRVSLVTDAVRQWDDAKGKATVEMIAGSGGRLTTTDAVLAELGH